MDRDKVALQKKKVGLERKSRPPAFTSCVTFFHISFTFKILGVANALATP